jgi:hypothetical protein
MDIYDLIEMRALLAEAMDKLGNAIMAEQGRMLKDGEAEIIGGNIVYLANEAQIERGKEEELGGEP